MLIGWTTALAALAASTAVLGAGVWLVRESIAEFLIGAILAERGVVADFEVAALDLNHGGYVDWGGSTSTPAMRTVGQKHVKAGRAHLWIQNSGHTWKAVVDGRPIAPVSGSIRVPGFEPQSDYDVEWWNTWDDSEPARQHVKSDAAGVIVLDVEALAKDVAVTVRRSASR